MQEIEDTSNQIMLKNVAIGTGVILVCVTVSAVTGGAGAPAVSMIFAVSAKTGTIMALSSGGLGAVSAGIVRGIQTGDFNEAMEAAALAGSEGFKWGAIIGSLEGGITQTVALKGASLNGLTMNEAAKIQKESGLPLSFIKNFHSMNEYNVYKNAGLQLTKVNGKLAYTQKIDWDFIGDVADGRTNAQRVIDGLAPLDSTGSPYDLEQREGRINRFKCLAIRQNVADKYGKADGITFKRDIWTEMFEAAKAEKQNDQSELVPFWCFGKNQSVKIERLVPMYPMSKDEVNYERLIKILSLYRLTLGQARQEELLEYLFKEFKETSGLKKLFIDLSPFSKGKEG